MTPKKFIRRLRRLKTMLGAAQELLLHHTNRCGREDAHQATAIVTVGRRDAKRAMRAARKLLKKGSRD